MKQSSKYSTFLSTFGIASIFNFSHCNLYIQHGFNWHSLFPKKGFPGGSEVKVSACNAGDLGSIPGSGRSPGEGNSNPLQYSCLENPMNGGAWWATVHRVAELDTT